MGFADKVIGESREKKSEVVAGVHVARAHFAAVLGPLFRNESAAHGPFAADPDSGEQAANGDFPYVLSERSQESENRIAQNRERQRAHAAKPVGDRPPNQRHSPAYEKQRKQ